MFGITWEYFDRDIQLFPTHLRAFIYHMAHMVCAFAVQPIVADFILKLNQYAYQVPVTRIPYKGKNGEKYSHRCNHQPM